jgi:SAM-dependent methyltransferase
MIVPIFPTVYNPVCETDKIYYDAILENVQEGDKVLVVGCGSGADSWVAWTRCKTKIYAIDINEMAILNTYATANIGGFEVRPICGDIRDIELPDDFKDFDWVLWNLPFMHTGRLEYQNHHDGDDGSVIEAFVKLLPQLGRRAIIIGTDATLDYVSDYAVLKTDGRYLVLLFGESVRCA